MAPRRHVAAAAALLALSLAACDGGSANDSPPTTPTTVSFPEDPYKAPSVPDPVEADAFVEKPCDSLTSNQQDKYTLKSAGPIPPRYPDGPPFSDTCFYSYTSDDRWIRISYAREGLQHVYESGPSLGTRWEPQVLDGYPAVARYLVDRHGVPLLIPGLLL